MFPLGRQRVVFGHDGPAVFFGAILDFLAPGIDHGLNGESHADLEFFKRARLAVMQNLGLFVKYAANAMPTKFAHHAEAVAFGKFLDCPTDVAQVGPRLDHHDAVPHGVKGKAAKPLGGDRAVAHDEHAAGVAMPAILDDGYVDVDDVALFERFFVRNAVANLVIDRCAN